MLFLGIAAASPLREKNRSHQAFVFTPAGGGLITPRVHDAACRRPEWGRGPRPVLGQLELDDVQSDER